MKTILIATLVLTGCTGEALYVCSDNVFAEVRYSEPVDCAYSRSVTEAAKKAVIESGLWTHPDLKSTVLVVRPVTQWYDGYWDATAEGMQTPGRIDVGSNYSGLVHEMFHAKDYLEFDLPRLLAPLHFGWDTDGRFAADVKWCDKMTGRRQ